MYIIMNFLKPLFQSIAKHILKLIISRESTARTINKEICSKHKGNELMLVNASNFKRF